MSTSGMYAKFRTKKSVLNATELVVILGMVASAIDVQEQAQSPEKPAITNKRAAFSYSGSEVVNS